MKKKNSIRYPEPEKVRVRDSINVIIKGIYFVHLFLVLIYSSFLIILEPKTRMEFSGSFALILVYGLMLIWVMIFNFVSVLLKREKLAVWCDRFIVKMIIMMFPVFSLITYFHDFFLEKRSVRAFMFYHIAVSILMIFFEIYSCTCGHHDEPGYLYEPNELGVHANEVQNVRNEYNTNKLKRKATV